MPPRSFDANNDFGLEVLRVIATDPESEHLAKNLILKGGGALLHGHHSGRATRRDLDFGLWARIKFGKAEVDEILVKLDEWQPTAGAPRDDHEGSANIPITFRHPRTRQPGSMEMQVSLRMATIPPRLKDKVQRMPLETVSGETFDFLFMPLEEIVAEKVMRSFNPAKGPREEDLYDIGFAQELGIDYADVDWLFNNLRRTEGRNFNFPSQGRRIEDVAQDIDAPSAATRIQRSQLYEPYVSLEEIQRRVKAGASLVMRLGKVPATPD